MKPPVHIPGVTISARELSRAVSTPPSPKKSPKSRDLLWLLIVPFRPAAPEPLTLE